MGGSASQTIDGTPRGTPARPRPPRLRRVGQVLRRDGVDALSGRLLRRALHPLVSWRTVSFYVLPDLAKASVPEVRARIPLEVRLAGKADWARLHEFVLRIGRTRGHIEARRDRGDLCFVALSEGRLVHFFWVATSPTWVPQIRATVEVRPGDAYGYDSFTDETVRGQAVQPVVTSVVLRYEQAHGFARHFFYADRHSPAALQILGKLGGVSWTLTRTVRSFQIAGAKAFLVIGLDSGGEPRLEPAANARRLGPFGYWSHEQP